MDDVKKRKLYTSTRNKQLKADGPTAILQGQADDGGLYVMDTLTKQRLPLADMMHMTYKEMAATVLMLLLPDMEEEVLAACVEAAYTGRFSDERITPLTHKDDLHILELFHGPTCAFKDIGLQLLPQLMKAAQQHKQQKVMILTATSGDTGKAALEGFQDVAGTSIIVFYPQDGVSAMQQRQMCVSEGKRSVVCAVRGNFDDAQQGVKQLFCDTQLKQRLAGQQVVLSSANSINIGRLIPQIVYYIYAYKDMVEKQQIRFGEPLSFCVPTGNFGNVLAGYYAKQMGLPVRHFLVASNANRILYDFLQTGSYDRRRAFHKTISPSMDILISSNLERLLYDKSGGNDVWVAQLMKQLQRDGHYQLPSALLASIQADFIGGWCEDAACREAMRACWESYHYLLDPHTAVGYRVMKQYQQQEKTPCVLLATASPYKFAPDVELAVFGNKHHDAFAAMLQLEKDSGAAIPSPLAQLREKPLRHRDVIDIAMMRDYVESKGKELNR